ncbi:unnamed protein product [Cylindrotheca closterium]|uniref:Helicase-associated domain-containing protein n=1 Tax=Cylindrotheca closterium TaxID=2856 RepID=A0AAD2JGY7_9STRA|nr:unnamed protein product [Cylindrotheca closterium]
MAMIIAAENEKHRTQSESCSYSNILDEGLLSLVVVPQPPCPLPFFEPTTVSSSPFVSLPLSFEDPFEDPSMEPIPLGPDTSSCQQVSSLQSAHDASSLFVTDGADGLPDSFIQLNKRKPTGAKSLRQDLLNILDPVVDLLGPKRSSEDLSSNNEQGPCKRQRTRQLEEDAVDSESRARFRPYQEQQWREQFQKLIQYKLAHGHCCVPHSYPVDPILARWVKRQRYQYKKFQDRCSSSTMTTRRIQDLESIGFVWHSHAVAWKAKLNELMIFKQQRGHCNVPSYYPENVSLSTWVKCQRRQYKMYVSGSPSSTMTMERFQMLQSLGFVFHVPKSRM